MDMCRFYTHSWLLTRANKLWEMSRVIFFSWTWRNLFPQPRWYSLPHCEMDSTQYCKLWDTVPFISKRYSKSMANLFRTLTVNGTSRYRSCPWSTSGRARKGWEGPGHSLWLYPGYTKLIKIVSLAAEMALHIKVLAKKDNYHTYSLISGFKHKAKESQPTNQNPRKLRQQWGP